MLSCGERIRELRKGKNLSLEQLSREVGVSSDMLRDWEQGTSLPEPGKMLVLAAVLGTTADYLHNGTKARGKNTSDTYKKIGSACFLIALILYFVGMGTGEFDQQMMFLGTPLLNYGTSVLAGCLLISATLCIVSGVFCKIYSARLKNQER